MQAETEVAVLFADVVGSTHLYEVLGDLRARDTILLAIDLMKQATERNRGTVIKTIGDEILSIFPTANDAVNAAAEIQHDISAHPELILPEQHVAVRIGCHFGPVVLQNQDIFGATVHTANRMASQAKAGQVLTTSDTVERLSTEWRACTRRIDVAPVRGRSEEIELFEVLWQQEDATSMLPSIEMGTPAGQRQLRMTLHYQGREYVLENGRRSLTLGRAEENDVVVEGHLISRLHARIEAQRNRFVLVDQSTNGTFVMSDEGQEAFVRRDDLTLQGTGLIGLGRVPEANSPDAIQFQLED
jgi:class 3 adenylate cyclase